MSELLENPWFIVAVANGLVLALTLRDWRRSAKEWARACEAWKTHYEDIRDIANKQSDLLGDIYRASFRPLAKTRGKERDAN